MQRVGFWLGVGLFVLMMALEPPDGLSLLGWRTAAVTVLMDAGRGQLLHQRATAAFDLSAIETRTAATLGLGDAETSAGAMAPPPPGDRVHDGHPDMADLLRLPLARRSVPPAALYIRPPDAVLPL